MNREEWLHRYRARLIERRPGLTSRDLDDFAGMQAYADLCVDHPEQPEKAADAEIGEWDKEDRAN
ncbi:MAG: hypothetical protein ACREVV_17095 [Steroidobacteraceae bacterium]